MIFMGLCTFCGGGARVERITTECVPSYGGAHEELGSSERPESPQSQGNLPSAFVRVSNTP
jgi:hypothetical protein